MDVQQLHTAVAAVCPIDGVSVGRWNDKATWRIKFAPDATDAQRAAALDVIAKADANQPLSTHEKLARLGLSVDDLKVILTS